MSKLLLIPSDTNIKDYECADAFLFGIKGLSVNYPNAVSKEEIKKLTTITDKEIFVSLNKNMVNEDLKELEETLKYLDKLNIKGIFYYDVAIVNLKQKLNLKTDLVWAQEHFLTNSYTSNFWYDRGVKYGLVASEITKEEIKDLINNSKMQLIVPIFGYQPMFVSFRHLVANYLKTFNLKDDSKIYYIEKEGYVYPVIDDMNTTVYSSYILNGFNERMDVDYLLLNSFNIDKDKMLKVLDIYKNGGTEEEINKLFNSISKGFLYKETVYKVKNNE